MLKNLEEDSQNRFSIQKLFDVFSESIHSTRENETILKYTVIVQTILITLFQISILFQSSIIPNQDLYLTTLIQINSFIDFSLIQPTQTQYLLIVESIMMTIMLSCIILNILFYVTTLNSVIFYLIVIYCNKLFNILSIPIFYMVIGSFFKESNANNLITIILEILFILFFFIHLFFVKFNFDPVLKNNKYYKSKTDYGFYQYILWFVKILFLKAYRIDFNMLFLILCFEIARIILIDDRSHPQLAFLQKIPAYFSSTIAMCLLINTFLNNTIEFEIILSSLIICLLVGFVLRFQRINANSIKELKNCKNIIEGEFRAFVHSWELKLTSQKDKQFNQRLYKGFIRRHSETCQHEDCFMKRKESISKQECSSSNKSLLRLHFQKFVLQQLEILSRKSQEFAILYLQKLYEYKQIGLIKTFNVKITNYCYSFIVYHIKKMNTFNQINEDFNDIEQNYIQLKKYFYVQMKKVVIKLKIFFTELKEKRPSLNLLEEYGHESYIQIEQLKKIYDKINQNDRTDLRVIEFYLEFLKNFMKDEAQVEQTVKKAKKKMTTKFKDSRLEESSLPTLSINIKQGGMIVDMNCEAMKVLRCHIVQINDRRILDFLLPTINPESFQTFFMSILNKPVTCLLTTISKQMIPVKINSRIRQNLYNKQYYIQITCINQLKQQFYLLITKDITLDQSFLNEKVSFNFCLKISLQEFFDEYIKPKFQLLKSQSHLQVYQQNGFRVIATIQQTIHPENSMVKLILKKQTTIVVDEKVIQNSFSFKVTGIKDKIMIDGNKNPNPHEFCLSFENDANNNKNANNNLIVRDYSKGIKLYRLHDEQLYNIQLQNLKSEVEMCIHQQHDLYEQSKRIEQQKTIIQFIYFILFLLLVIILIVSFVNYFDRINIIDSDINKLYQQEIKIQYFQILYYRILCILNDVQLSLNYSVPYNWNSEIKNLITHIKMQQKSLLFNNSQFTIKFDNRSYTTCTDQHMNIILSKVYQISNKNLLDSVQEIHYLFATTFYPIIHTYKQQLSQHIVTQIQKYESKTLMSMVIFIFLYLVELGFLIVFSYFECEKRKNILLVYRIKSDAEIQSILQKLEKLTIVLELSTKHQEIDLFEMFDDKKQFTKREKPKELTNKIIEFSAILILIKIFTLIIVIFYAYTYILSIDFSNHLLNFYKTSSSIIQCYIGIQRIAPITTYGIDFQQIQLMQKGLAHIEKNRFTLPFSTGFSNYINTLFFRNSCSFVMKISPNSSCDKYGLSYSVENPFSIGFLYYFHLIHFQLANNVTNVYPAVGGISYPFQQLFLNISNQSSLQWSQNITNVRYNEQIYLIIQIFFLVLMLIIIMLFSCSKAKEVQNSQKIKDIIKEEQVFIPNNYFKSLLIKQ